MFLFRFIHMPFKPKVGTRIPVSDNHDFVAPHLPESHFRSWADNYFFHLVACLSLKVRRVNPCLLWKNANCKRSHFTILSLLSRGNTFICLERIRVHIVFEKSSCYYQKNYFRIFALFFLEGFTSTVLSTLDGSSKLGHKSVVFVLR